MVMFNVFVIFSLSCCTACGHKLCYKKNEDWEQVIAALKQEAKKLVRDF